MSLKINFPKHHKKRIFAEVEKFVYPSKRIARALIFLQADRAFFYLAFEIKTVKK